MVDVEDHPDADRYELREDGELVALAAYRRHDGVVDLIHTETLPGHDGRGHAATLIRHALDDIRARGERVRPFCPYARSFIDRHREYVDLVPADQRARFHLDGEAPPPSARP